MLGELRGQVNGGADLRQRGDLRPAQLRAVSRISWWDVTISVRYPSVLARTRKSCAVWPGFGCITVTDDLDAEKLRFSSSPFSVLLLLSQSPFPKLLLRLAASHLFRGRPPCRVVRTTRRHGDGFPLRLQPEHDVPQLLAWYASGWNAVS